VSERGKTECMCGVASVGRMPTLYEGTRDELTYYFGPELVAELDEIAAEVAARGVG